MQRWTGTGKQPQAGLSPPSPSVSVKNIGTLNNRKTVREVRVLDTSTLKTSLTEHQTCKQSHHCCTVRQEQSLLLTEKIH